MTREEAKEILTHNWTRVDNPNYSESELDEAFFMAIEALSAEPSDLISRADVFEIIDKAFSQPMGNVVTLYADICLMLNALSTHANSRSTHERDLINRADAIEAVNMLDIFPPTKDAVARELMAIPSADAEPSLKAIKRQIDEHWYLDPPSANAYTEQQVRDAYNDGYSCGIEQTKEALKAEPILCKECQHWEGGHCRQFGRDIPMNAYCSYALPNVDERREL